MVEAGSENGNQKEYSMAQPRYLTKSRFKLATECSAKLYYTGKKQIYPDNKLDDPFMMALADGGYQVGELAKYYYPGGHNVEYLDYDKALAQTNSLLNRDDVTIYEAAIRYENLFIRVDVLVKRGQHLELVEVKSKSIDRTSDAPFLTNNGFLNSSWKSYLYDVAFQKHVVRSAFPDAKVCAYLMLINKDAICPVDGLNQKFRTRRNSQGRKVVEVSADLADSDLVEEILCKVNVDRYCDQIFSGEDSAKTEPLSFVDRIMRYSDYYAHDQKLLSKISAVCGQCEFRATPEEETEGKKSGFKECWSKALHWTDKDFKESTVLDIWNYRGKDKLILEGQIKLTSIHEEDINPLPDGKAGLSRSERQWLQVQKSVAGDQSVWIDKENLTVEMASWTYPLHFIDFETTMVALPFNKGRKPYEGIAFQFSHHIVYKDGQVEHKGEYLNTQQGVFPSYDFVRALKIELETDEGSIFRYSNHENSYLNMIYRQLKDDSDDIPDRDALCKFIRSITHSKKDSCEKWEGERDMIDLWELVKRYYYDPYTKGSNSIKHVLPAILNSSAYLQEKYVKPLYGADRGISSCNFNDWAWVRIENGEVVDPYKLLPKMFEDVSVHDMELLSEEDELNNGGTAMTAYARMQFEEMSDYERDNIRLALLKYCELDTLAMVMIYEGWRDMVSH